MEINKTYLVTGGAGFIGSHLCESLLDKGNKVICFDNLSSGKEENISDLKNNSNFIFIKGDANKIEYLEPIFKALGIALDQATRIDPRRKGIPSTKGLID